VEIANKKIDYVILDKKSVNLIKPLWEKLNKHHENESIHFKEKYLKFTFDQRMDKLFCKNNLEDIRIEIARLNDVAVGYCISSTLKDGSGEIESIYIEPEFRGYRIGEDLINSSLNWMESRSVNMKKIVVSGGNEDALSFYKKFGFFTEYITLRQK